MKNLRAGKFDKYISLGDNCEAGLQFWRIGYNESSIFRFTIADSDDVLTLIKNDFARFFLKENLKPASIDHMVRDQQSNIAFHSALYSTIDKISKKRVFRKYYDFDKVFCEEKKKVEYFVDKWRNLVSSQERVLYFIKKNQCSSREDAEKILNVFQSLYPKHNFLILYIQPQKLYKPDWGLEKLHNVYVDFLAPYDNSEAGADIKGWNKIFADYPLRNKPANPPALDSSAH